MAAVVAEEGTGATLGAAQVSLEALVTMFSSVPRSCVEDVYQQCGSDGAKALDFLLKLNISNASPEVPDKEVMEFLPYLAPMLSSPSPSGTSSPARTTDTPGVAGTVALSLLNKEAASYSDLFPNLPIEIVTDVLQRYDDSGTAIRHLMMLSHCVTEAGGRESSGPATEMPDEASWGCDSGSSSGDEGSADAACEGMDSVAKLEYLRVRFPMANSTEVQQVLEACEERVGAAEQVLQCFVSEDATAAREPSGSGSVIRAGVSGTSTVTQHPSPATEPGEVPVPSPAECAARLEQLCKCFPTMSKEFVEIALQSVSYDLAGAHKVLLDQGYSEVVEVDLPQPQPQHVAQQQLSTALPVSAPAPIPLPTTLVPSVLAGQTRSPPKDLSKLTYERNEKIYQEERAPQRRLSEACRRCRELAWQYRQRGEYSLAEQLYQQAARYAEQEEHEAKLASRRIGKRVNAGFTECITEDLHGKHVKEVLDMVQEQIYTLPKCFSRGVKIKYITGKGLHSTNGAKIKPSLMEMLADHNIPFVEGPGYVIATFAPA
ncbi:hypothetical protein N2152v2_001774 [Parachlorella kessleri]